VAAGLGSLATGTGTDAGAVLAARGPAMGTACSTAASAVAEPAEKGHHHQRLCMPAPAEGTVAAATGWRYRRRRRRGRRACVPPRQLRADRRPRSGRGTDGREPEGKGEGGAMARDPDGREGEDRVQ